MGNLFQLSRFSKVLNSFLSLPSVRLSISILPGLDEDDLTLYKKSFTLSQKFFLKIIFTFSETIILEINPGSKAILFSTKTWGGRLKQDGIFLFQITHHGLTGHIEFREGKRNNFKLDLLKLKKEELRKVGHWSPGKGINITDPTAFYESSVTNITLIVMTREVQGSKPFYPNFQNINLRSQELIRLRPNLGTLGAIDQSWTPRFLRLR